jgi:hypothetical protein
MFLWNELGIASQGSHQHAVSLFAVPALNSALTVTKTAPGSTNHTNGALEALELRLQSGVLSHRPKRPVDINFHSTIRLLDMRSFCPLWLLMSIWPALFRPSAAFFPPENLLKPQYKPGAAVPVSCLSRDMSVYSSPTHPTDALSHLPSPIPSIHA